MLVVVGGNSRNIGKTSVAVSIIRGTAQLGWTALKITQYGHGKCAKGGDCECAGQRHRYALTEEIVATGKDSGRFLGAGASKAYWLRTEQQQLGNALPVLKTIFAENENVICESNSLLQFYKPDAYVMVLDGRVEDMKQSARLYFDRADAYALVSGGAAEWPWDGLKRRTVEGKPHFLVSPPDYASAELAAWIAARKLGLGQ